MMRDRRLLLDAGNTRLKWAVVDKGQWLAHGGGGYDEPPEWLPFLQNGMPCYVASVVRDQHKGRLQELLTSYAIIPVWLSSEVQFAELRNTYVDSKQLGVDRWMALIAARQRSQASTLVVSVGTAMTVDALSAEGAFLGGLIVPGMRMMAQALLQGTAQVIDVDGGDLQVFPQSTADAVRSGSIAAMKGAIRIQYEYLKQATGESPHCLMTGGDAAYLLPHLDMPVEWAPLLILEGMERVTREGESV